MGKRLLAGFVLLAGAAGAGVALVIGSAAWAGSDNDVFQGWRPLAPNEVCPQQPNGHVEMFVDDAEGRHWIRPQQDGHDIPCGLARPI